MWMCLVCLCVLVVTRVLCVQTCISNFVVFIWHSCSLLSTISSGPKKHRGGTDRVMVTAMSQTCWSKDVIVTLSMSAVTYVPGQRLEFPLRIQIRFQGRKWFPGQTSASMWLRKTWGTCGLSVKCVYWSLSFLLWRSGEAESARGASDSERAHSLLLHLHFMFSLTTPWPEGGNKPCFQRTAMWYRPHSCFNTHTHCTLFSLD